MKDLRKRLYSPLARKQLVYILIFSSLTTLIGTSIQLYFDFRDDMNFIDKQLMQIEKAHLPSLVNSLWSLDSNQINIQLQNMLSFRDIIGLEIRENGKILFSTGDTGNGSVVHRRLEMVYASEDRREPIGMLHVYASLEGVYNRLLGRVLVILTTQGVKTFIVSLFILFIINHLVTRHLTALAGHMRTYVPGDDIKPFVMPKRAGPPDELDDMATAINAMQKRLHEDLLARNRANQALRDSENRLRRSEALLQTVLSNLDEAVLLVNPETRLIEECNKTTETIFGYPRKELIGKDTSMLHVNRDMFVQFGRESFATYSSQGWFAGEFRMKRCNGEIFPTEHYVTGIAGEKAHPSLVVSIVRDISGRKQMEEKLQQARKLEAIGTLTGGIAHNFNNILSMILGNTELAMLKSQGRNELMPQLEGIRSACTRAKHVIAQLLQSSRPMEQKPIPVAMHTLVDDALQRLQGLLENIEIEKNIAPSPWLVLADIEQMRDVLLNVFSNALHAMENHGGRLEIDIDNASLPPDEAARAGLGGGGDYLRITVRDTGAGVPDHIRNRVFDPYFTTKDVDKGSGMGLALVNGIIRQYKGAVKLESLPGKGTTVEMLIPAMKEHVPQTPQKVAAGAPGKGRILMVDDEPFLTDMGKALMETLGYRVSTTNSPDQALSVVLNNPHSLDLLITDLTMPGMDGIELARQALSVRHDLTVVLCSGLGVCMDKEKANKAGIRFFLDKPFSLEQLSDILGRAMIETNDGGI